MFSMQFPARAAVYRSGAAVLTLVILIAVGRPALGQQGDFVIFGYNDLGMHCMNEDASEFLLLPPYNTLRAQVLSRRDEHPLIISSGVTLRYMIQDNTHSADKTNFWSYTEALFGVKLAPNVGLTGNGLAGELQPAPEEDWVVTGIPITPLNDAGREDPYPLATITVLEAGKVVARTQAVVPVSWEINCNLCHNTAGISVATDILRAHDRLHGTTLESRKPVLCAECHADPALGAPGQEGVPTLTSAMHAAHAPRMDQVALANKCYACHPGLRTQCQRDVHFEIGLQCVDCHGGMEAVGDPARRPWVDQPRCGDCHARIGFEFEQRDTLYRNSVGHGGVHCTACHNSPHAITPTVTEIDNQQAIVLQGHAGKIDKCTVCHTEQPEDPFFHSRDD